MNAILKTLLGLVNIYSPSGNERKAVDFMVHRMRKLNYQKTFIDKAGNAVGMIGDGPRQIILLGHIDTVPGEIPVRVEKDLLYGRGAVDAKASLVSFIEAVARLGAIPGWQFIVIGAVEEERDSEGARFVASHYHPDFAIIGEPNRWNRIALGYKGVAWANILIQRGVMHTAGVQESVCETAVGVWLTVKAWAECYNIKRERAFDQLLLTLRDIESRKDDFQQWASLNIGARLPLDLPPQAWYARLKGLAEKVHVKPLGFALPAFRCEKNTPLVRAFLRGIRSIGGSPNFVYKTGTADLNVVAPAWKCPTLVYGPGDSALDHAPDEYVSLEECAKAIEVIVMALKALVSM